METFTHTQDSIIVGSLLGDGYVSNQRKKNWNCYFSKTQTISRRTYVDWHYEQLKPFSLRVYDQPNWSGTRSQDNKGKTFMKSVFVTHCHPAFTALREKWYPNNKKAVPEDIRLDPLSIAIWFFDDGNNSLSTRNCMFATCAFTQRDCEILIEQLRLFDIKAAYSSTRIRVVADSYERFVSLIKPYMIWDVFQHKVAYRDRLLNRLTEAETLAIVSCREEGMKLVEIAKKFGISVSCAHAVSSKKTKPHLWSR